MKNLASIQARTGLSKFAKQLVISSKKVRTHIGTYPLPDEDQLDLEAIQPPVKPAAKGEKKVTYDKHDHDDPADQEDDEEDEDDEDDDGGDDE